MYTKPINSIDDVKDFFKYLALHGQCYHPDEFAGQVITGADSQRVFTDEEVAIYDELMSACFYCCTNDGEDIYFLMTEAGSLKADDILECPDCESDDIETKKYNDGRCDRTEVFCCDCDWTVEL